MWRTSFSLHQLVSEVCEEPASGAVSYRDIVNRLGLAHPGISLAWSVMAEMARLLRDTGQLRQAIRRDLSVWRVQEDD